MVEHKGYLMAQSY